jgi:hypothetical protein
MHICDADAMLLVRGDGFLRSICIHGTYRRWGIQSGVVEITTMPVVVRRKWICPRTGHGALLEGKLDCFAFTVEYCD